MKTKHTLLLLLLAPLMAFTVHKYYLSLTQIAYNNKDKTVEVIINVFIDDIETALNKIHSKELRLNTKKEPTNTDMYFEKYVQNHIQFKIDDMPVTYTYLGKEYEGDIVYFYLEIKNIERVQTIEIKNTLLVDFFPNQQNLVKSKVNNVHKSVLLTKENDKGLLKYK
ncbi:MAG: hypothetical protein P8K77_00590 [Polaribacter sp.]|nr:hypothetical protein [Polaribacter sp.]